VRGGKKARKKKDFSHIPLIQLEGGRYVLMFVHAMMQG
jgi:hypothetical protein